MNLIKITILLSLCLMGISCSKESITPAFGIEKISDQIGDISLSYDVDEEVDGFGGEFSDVGGDDVGSVLRRLATSFADIELRENGGAFVEIPLQVFEFPELKDIDFTYIKEVEFTTVQVDLIDTTSTVEVSEEAKSEENEPTNPSLSLDFVQELQVFLIVDSMPDTIPNISPTYMEGEEPNTIYSGKKSTLLFSYSQNDKEEVKCDSKCINLKIDQSKIKDILKQNTNFIIDIRLKVGAVPKNNLKLKTRFDFKIKFDPGF
ncbi:hypothetical protein [Halobacteriovorax sp. HLS]|uniref:hypothetical protein n=1 Tax=Halobacteriovorax sp. HLS TaxID=2234000 RepID=UPI000FDACEA0|nr:hypothetical protein [Halobacteriovorax sp. HLS]